MAIKETKMVDRHIKICIYGIAIIGIVFMVLSYAYAEPKSVINDEQRTTLASKQANKNDLKGVKAADINACADVACLKPLIVKILKAVKDNSGAN